VAHAGATLPLPIRARVRDRLGAPMAGHFVTYYGEGQEARVLTDADGVAAFVWTLQSRSGIQSVRAMGRIGAPLEVMFTATSTAGPPARAVMADAGEQLGWPSQPAPGTPRVLVTDADGIPLGGVPVRFGVTSGGGMIASFNEDTTRVDGTAAAGMWWLGPAPGLNTMTATFPGTSLAPVVFKATSRYRLLTRSYTSMHAAMAGTQVPAGPAVVVTDNFHDAVRGVKVAFTVTSGGGSVRTAHTVTDDIGVAHLPGWVLGAAPGINTLTATTPDDPDALPLTISAVGCSGGGGTGFAITLCITSELKPSQRAAFESAAARWADIIRGDLPDVHSTFEVDHCGRGSPRISQTFDDVVIFAGIRQIDGRGTVLARAGWCARRQGGLPMLGVMEFDEADVAPVEEQRQLVSLILHEMGHVLGIGTIWSELGLLQNPSSSGQTLDTYYSGAGGLAGFDIVGGTTYTGGLKVPVENTGGPGTMNGHWRESVLGYELMTGYLSPTFNPVSALTVRSLADLGYIVEPGAGDPFTMGLAARANRLPGGTGSLKIHDDAYTGPRYTVDRRGRRTRIR
jgi:hypothetical protein